MKIKVVLKAQEGVAYSQSKYLGEERRDDEGWTEFEKRVWRDRAHYSQDGYIVVPPFSLKAMLDTTATYLGEKVPGDRNRKFGKIFASGLRVQATAPLLLIKGKKIKRDDLVPEWINAHYDGKRGSGKRVARCYPIFYHWSMEVEFSCIDPRITREVLIKHLVAAGNYIGIGRFRAEKGGFHGCFDVYVNGKKVEQQVELVRRVDEEEDEEQTEEAPVNRVKKPVAANAH